MICPNCQSENPGNNRFCGQCGEKLAALPDRTQPSEPASAQDTSGSRRPFIVSTTAMADVTAQMLNTRVAIPSPSLNSTSHSGYSSPLKNGEGPVISRADDAISEPAPVDPKDEPIFTQHPNVHEFDLDSADLHASQERMESAAAEYQAHMPVSEAPRSGSILGLTAPVVMGSSAPRIEETREPVHEERSEPEPSYSRNSFLHFDEAPADSDRTTDVSGPSFLGLGSSSGDYLYEEQQPRSYGRLIIGLIILGAFAVLGALEWRASQNGDSTNPMEVLHFRMPKKKGQGGAELVQQPTQPSASPADTSAANSVTNNGKPDLIAEPNQPAVKKQPEPQEESLPAQGAQPTPQSPNATRASSDNANASNSQAPLAPAWATGGASSANSKSIQPEPPSSKSAQLEAQPKTQPKELAKAAPPANTKPTAAPTREPRNPKPASASDNDPESDASLNGGAAELQKGIAAGDTELGRMWLWKALGKGNGEAPVRLADMYASGKGVPKDCEQAMLILHAAAKKANVRARSKLASMYATGSCVPQDRVQAYKWMSAALEANPGSEWLTKNRDTLFQQMSPAERQRASR